MRRWSAKYPLTELGLEVVPRDQGVYRLWRRDADGYICFYVGQAKDLRRSLSALLRGKRRSTRLRCNLSTYACRFDWRITRGDDERKRLKQAELRRLKLATDGSKETALGAGRSPSSRLP